MDAVSRHWWLLLLLRLIGLNALHRRRKVQLVDLLPFHQLTYYALTLLLDGMSDRFSAFYSSIRTSTASKFFSPSFTLFFCCLESLFGHFLVSNQSIGRLLGA